MRILLSTILRKEDTRQRRMPRNHVSGECGRTTWSRWVALRSGGFVCSRCVLWPYQCHHDDHQQTDRQQKEQMGHYFLKHFHVPLCFTLPLAQLAAPWFALLTGSSSYCLRWLYTAMYLLDMPCFGVGTGPHTPANASQDNRRQHVAERRWWCSGTSWRRADRPGWFVGHSCSLRARSSLAHSRLITMHPRRPITGLYSARFDTTGMPVLARAQRRLRAGPSRDGAS